MSERVHAYVALGANLGDRAAALVGAREALERSAQTRVIAASRLWETAPVGPAGQGEYLNAVIALDTDLAAPALLDRLLALERAAGRDRDAETARWGPRLLDLDLLLYGDASIDAPGLAVPHPRLHERRFVLAPLCEIAPDRVHPVRGGTMAEHLARCPDEGDVRPWSGAAPWRAGPL